MKRLLSSVVAGVLLSALPAWAHVTVAPRESRPGVSERYTVRVPTEGKVSTVEVELEIPESVTISPQASTGWTHTLKRTGDSVTAIVWVMEIKPGEFAEFGFIGRNPKTGSAIAWKAHQRYADGTATHWVGEPGTRSPAPMTTLVAAAQDESVAVTQWLGTYDAAFNAKDLDKLATFYHPDVTSTRAPASSRPEAFRRSWCVDAPPHGSFLNRQFMAACGIAARLGEEKGRGDLMLVLLT